MTRYAEDGTTILPPTYEEALYRPLPALVATTPDEDPNRPTWAALVRHEPELAQVLLGCQYLRSAPDEELHPLWYREFRPQLSRLAGRGAQRDDPFLVTVQAFDVASRTCYHALTGARL